MNAKITPTKAGGTAGTRVGVGASSLECTAPVGARTTQRLRVWEIAAMFHCSLLGTCLPLSERSDIARRARCGLPPRASAYEVHTCFVKSLASCNSLSKLVDKALERRHEGAPCGPFGAPATSRSSRARWKEMMEGGNVAGAYWAVMSHPLSTEALQWRPFGDVHMLSHLLGSSRRSDLCRLHKLEVACAELGSELALVKHQHRAALKQRNKLRRSEPERARCRQARAASIAGPGPYCGAANPGWHG